MNKHYESTQVVAMEIFGNPIGAGAERKARRQQQHYIKKFGFDSHARYNLTAHPNPVLGRTLGIQNLSLSAAGNAVADRKSIIVATLRMGYGHYRIAMAAASAAHSMGVTPYWLDLIAFPETTGSKIITHLERLYSLGSRLSQRFPLFNRFYWEPLNSEGFKKLSFNASDRLMCELMAPLYGSLPRHIPVVGTHAWPAIAAVHAGMNRVVKMIPDNWPMALHLAEGAIHTIQTPSSYMGYRTLKNMGKKGTPMNPIPPGQIRYTGHYVDHELVKNLAGDCAARIKRIDRREPRRILLPLGGAGAQASLIRRIITHLAPAIRDGKVILYMNSGDHADVYEQLNAEMARLRLPCQRHTEWQEIVTFAHDARKSPAPGVHHFYSSNIFAAVYTTNLLMPSCDFMITKPSELAYYPVPKIFIARVGGHEAWGAIRGAELGDGTLECETTEQALQALDLMIHGDDLLRLQCDQILKLHRMGVYNGAYRVVEIALAKR